MQLPRISSVTRSWLSIITLCALPPALPAQSPAVPEAIFRYIDIEPFGKIHLGRPFQQRQLLGEPVEPHLYRLTGPNGVAVRFADTDAILVQLDDAGLVRAFYFLYLPGKAFDSMVAEYAALGRPRRSEYDTAGIHIRSAKWQDSRTEFMVVERTRHKGQSAVSSVLRDRIVKSES